MPSSFRSTTVPRARRALTVAAVAVAITALTGCGAEPGAGTPQPTASGPATAPSDGQSPEPTASGSSEPDEPSTVERLEEALTSGATAGIEDLLTEPTRVVFAASEADMQYSAVDAVLALDYVRPGESTWDFALDDARLSLYAANPYYGEFFPASAMVGLSDAGPVVSFVPNGARIGTIFMAMDETLLTDY